MSRRALSLAILAALAGCAQQRPTEQAVDRVSDKQSKLDEERTKLDNARIELLGEISQVAKAQADLTLAREHYEARRNRRAAALSAKLSVIATEPEILSLVRQRATLPQAGQVQLTERIQVLNLRVREASLAVEALAQADAAHYASASDAAERAMQQAGDAAKAAWHALPSGAGQAASS